jgi:hypothetical protein
LILGNLLTGNWGLRDRCSARRSYGRNAVSVVTGLLTGPFSTSLGGFFLCGLDGLISCDSVSLGGGILGDLLDNNVDIHLSHRGEV